MSIKNKKTLTTSEKVTHYGQQAAVLLLSVMTTFGMLDGSSDRARSQVIVPNQPVFAFATENSEGNTPIRRSSEETETESHYVSYNESQRTPTRSGRR